MLEQAVGDWKQHGFWGLVIPCKAHCGKASFSQIDHNSRYTFAGTDAVIHIAEEMSSPERKLPLVMLVTEYSLRTPDEDLQRSMLIFEQKPYHDNWLYDRFPTVTCDDVWDDGC